MVMTYVQYGQRNFEFPGTKITKRADGLETLRGTWQADFIGYLKVDGAVPGHPRMLIEELEREDDGPVYLFNVTAVGLSGDRRSKRDKGYPKLTPNLEGLDEAQDSWLVSKAVVDNYGPGTRLRGNNQMVCLSSPYEPVHDDWVRVTPRYAGVLSGSSDRPYKRQISVNERIVNPSEPVQVGLPGGWSTPEKASVSMPTLCVTDHQVIIGGPNTLLIPGNATPPNPPEVNVFDISGDLTGNWPHGWKVASIDGEYIPGTNIWVGSIRYEYVWRRTF